MWTWGETLAAESGSGGDSYIVVIGGIVIAAIGTLGVVLAEVIKGRNSRTTASPPAPGGGTGKDVELYERTAVLNSRADDADDRHHALDLVVDGQGHRIDNHDTRLLRIERHLGYYSPDGDH